MDAKSIRIVHATLNHAQTNGVTERSHQKLTQTLNINANCDSPQWNKYFNLAVTDHSNTFHPVINCASTEIFLSGVPFNPLEWKTSNQI